MSAYSARSTRVGRHRAGAAAGCVATLLLAGCGSNLPDSKLASAERGGLDSLTSQPVSGGTGAATGQGATSGSGQLGSTGDGTTGAAPTTAGGNTTSGGSTGPSSATGSSGGTASGSGGNTSGSDGSRTGGTIGASAAGGACTAQGAPLVLGQVVSASGLIGQNVGSAVPTLQAWAKYINTQGGIACHPVQVISQDDGSDPGRSSSAVSDLVQNRHAQALVANFVPLSISGFRSAIDKERVPSVGGDLFSLDWWQDGLFYPVGTYVDANAIGGTAATAKLGATKVGVLYCLEASVCPPYKDAVVKGASTNGYSVVYQAQVSLTQPDFTSQCQNAKNAGATQMSMLIDGSAVSRLARSCASIGYYPKLSIGSLAATFDQSDTNIQRDTVNLASASGAWFDTGIQGQKAYLGSMSRYASSQRLDPSSSLAWVSAMMLVKAVDKLGPSARTTPITTAMIRKGLAMIKDETLEGMVPPTTFSASGAANAKNYCYFPIGFTSKYTGTKDWRCLK